MRNLLNPKWLLALNTFPILILFFLFWNDFRVIKSLLEPENMTYWQAYGMSLLLLALLNLGYTCYAIFRKQQISIYYGFISLVAYITFIYLYNLDADQIIPFSIPRWMLSSELILYVGTFLMPTLIHALFIIVIKLTAQNKDHKAYKNFLISAVVPISWYLLFQVITPFWAIVGSFYGEHMSIILIVIGTILFLFFLIRGIYILSLKKGEVWKKYQLFWKIPIAIVFPILGLCVNAGFLLGGFMDSDYGVFGDFNSVWFYGIAAMNGILICLPNTQHKGYRLVLYAARSITLTYTLYFFLVFLPFLPLSIIAIIGIGVGFLMLTPLVLFIIHIQELASDFSFLKQYVSKQLLFGVLGLSLLVLPLCLSASYYKDRLVLHETLDYIYHPDYSKTYNIDTTSLKNTLNVVIDHKSRRNDFIFGNQTPYLSAFFKWMVLDDLTLSHAKINTIERIFFNKASFGLRSENLVNTDVSISDISSTSTYDEDKNQWTSLIDLEITNFNTDRIQSEYATTIALPEGCWINDYYLYIGDRKEHGILAEKKSAMWVFNQIRNVRRDPGLLHYLTGNKVAFRVFPFAKNEVRKTGIQFIHKEPIRITIDDHTMALGHDMIEAKDNTIETEHIAYISTSEKQKLRLNKRTPYYHFIINTSKEKSKLKTDYAQIITNFLDQQPLSAPHKVSFSNTYSHTIALDKDWKSKLNTTAFEGGFYLERVIKTILFESYNNVSKNYPIIIVVSEDMQSSIIEKDFKDFKMAFPESDMFYHLNMLGDIASHDLTQNPKYAINENANIALDHSVLAWPNWVHPKAFLPNNNEASIVLKSPKFDVQDSDITTNNWTSGLVLQGKYMSHTLYPEAAETEWNAQVRYSFMSQIMTPLTSFIAVENEAQKAILLKKQEEVLSGKKSLDLNDDTQRMSEPGLMVLLILFGCFLFYKKRIRVSKR